MEHVPNLWEPPRSVANLFTKFRLCIGPQVEGIKQRQRGWYRSSFGKGLGWVCAFYTRRGCNLEKRFCKHFSKSSISLARQQGSCSTTLELSENSLQNLLSKLTALPSRPEMRPQIRRHSMEVSIFWGRGKDVQIVLGDLTGCHRGHGGKLRCSKADPGEAIKSVVV